MLQVWVITGDKQETAINIAISCKLIRNPDSLLICNASTQEEAHARLRELQQQLRQATPLWAAPRKGLLPTKVLPPVTLTPCLSSALMSCVPRESPACHSHSHSHSPRMVWLGNAGAYAG